ncbi:MAG: hypothetical protein NTY06_01555 [Candidatus Gottesmanbacteria bacterium]|nr:hypothetical protein [Candidatus Gottesmanbacteria bacterium]
MINKIVYLVLLLTLFFSLSCFCHPVLAANTYSFQVLVDINQIYPYEAEQATKFAADGVWTIPVNSSGVNWSTTFNTLNANKWIVSEDNPDSTSQVDYVSSTLGRMVDGAMFYNEDGLGTPLTDDQIAAYASHIVSSFGPVGNRIILLTRSYADGDPRQAQLNHALENPNVAGATFEFNPENYAIPSNLKFDAGCKHILNLGKKCYLLMPPSRTTTDYLSDIQKATNYFANAGLLNNPNVYFVVAVYVRADNDKIHFLSTDPNDRNSIESVVKWLNIYRGYTTPSPISCSSSTISSSTISSSNSLTVTMTANKPVKSFFLAFYNPDNLYGPGNPKPIYFEAGKQFSISKEATSLTQTMSFTINYADINKPDLNNNNQKPTNIQVNGYFLDQDTKLTSPPNINCVVQFNITRPGDLDGDGDVDSTDFNKIVAEFGHPYTIFDYNVLVGNFGK